jgi:hypothetical protein
LDFKRNEAAEEKSDSSGAIATISFNSLVML